MKTKRGLWRWCEEMDGTDVWRARVEIRHGEWADIEQASYESQAIQPPFWELPLKEEHVPDVIKSRYIGPGAMEYAQQENRIVAPSLATMIIIGGVIVSAAVGWWAFQQSFSSPG